MTVIRATDIEAAINQAMEADQGGRFRELLKPSLMELEDAYRGTEAIPFRRHLGASMIGQVCARKLWLSFRWVQVPRFDGRLLRLFNVGHCFEGTANALLRMIGCDIQQNDPQTGKQYRISDSSGHFGGSGDGMAYHQALGKFLVEYKTYGEKPFIKLVKEGVKECKPEHYAQIQCYLVEFQLDKCLYLAYNKNTSDIYLEWVLIDPEHGQAMIARGTSIALALVVPDKCSKSRASFTCKYCDYNSLCWDKEPIQSVNCRSCRHVEPLPQNGEWKCRKHNTIIPHESIYAQYNCWEPVILD